MRAGLGQRKGPGRRNPSVRMALNPPAPAPALMGQRHLARRYSHELLSIKSLYSELACRHCKDSMPKIRNQYSQKRNCVASVPIPTFMFLWAIYIFLRLVCLFCCRKIGGQPGEYIKRSEIHECENWDWAAQFLFWEYINRNFFAVYHTVWRSVRKSSKMWTKFFSCFASFVILYNKFTKVKSSWWNGY